jgi:perosamine synthetase
MIIEDIAQSMGADTGRASPVAVTSFYATKMLTTGGEGGMVFADDEGLAAYVRDRRDYDNRDDYVQRYNYKMTEMQAAIGRVQLRRLPGFVERRRAIAAQYSEAFAGLPITLPDAAGHVYFRYVVATADRDKLEAFLREHGVEAKRPVYRPLHHYFGGDFPGADRAHNECLSLPIYPTLTAAGVARVIELVRRYFA